MIDVKKIMFKIIIILIVISILEICMPKNYSKAYEDDEYEETSVTQYAKQMKGNASTTVDTSQLKTIIGRVIGAIQVIAGLITVLIVALTGFEYVLCQTPDMKNQLKKRMLPVIIALVLIFGAVSIAQFIMAVFE